MPEKMLSRQRAAVSSPQVFIKSLFFVGLVCAAWAGYVLAAWQGVWAWVTAAVVFGLALQGRRPLAVDRSTLAAILVHGFSASVLTTLFLALNQYFAPQAFGFWESPLLRGYFDSPGIFPLYNKAHIRSILVHSALATLAFTFFGLWWRDALHRWTGKALTLCPYHASAFLLALVGTAKMPPFQIDWAHWSTWLGHASETRFGRLPFYHQSSNQYGFVPLILMAGLLKLFEVKVIHLVVFVLAATFAAQWIVFLTISSAGRNRGFALLGMLVLGLGFHDLGAAVATVNMGAFRAQFPAALAVGLLWWSLRPGRSGWVGAVLYSLVCFWDLGLGFFATLAFLVVHLGRYLQSRDRNILFKAGTPLYWGMLQTILTFLILGTEGSPLVHLQRTVGLYRTYATGFGNLPQALYWWEFLLPLMWLITLWLFGARWLRGQVINQWHWFLLGSSIISLAWVSYASGRSNEIYAYSEAWAAIPPLLVVGGRLGAVLRFRIWTIALSLLLVPAANIPFHLVQRTGQLYMAEIARATWFSECSRAFQKGEWECRPEDVPKIADYWQRDEDKLVEWFFEGDDTRLLGQACLRGVPILSPWDGVVYALYECPAPTKLAALHQFFTRPLLQLALDRIRQHPFVLLDHDAGLYKFTRIPERQIHRGLLKNGYVETRVSNRLAALQTFQDASEQDAVYNLQSGDSWICVSATCSLTPPKEAQQDHVVQQRYAWPASSVVSTRLRVEGEGGQLLAEVALSSEVLLPTRLAEQVEEHHTDIDPPAQTQGDFELIWHPQSGYLVLRRDQLPVKLLKLPPKAVKRLVFAAGTDPLLPPNKAQFVVARSPRDLQEWVAEPAPRQRSRP